jgi:threonylcarbamoyladenosine tRNA methylthiotransferase MtaB
VDRGSSVKVSITTLGCRSNQYDSSAISEMLAEARFETVPFPARADAYIINTCTVTGRTDYQSRQLIRKALRLNPEALVIVTGCYAQVSPGEVARIEGVDYVLGNPEKGEIVECIEKGLHPGRAGREQKGPEVKVGPSNPGTPLTLRGASGLNRTRVNLKVQDGCDRGCTFCIVPRARGSSKSLPLDEVLTEIDTLVEKGFKEIVLTGIHLGAYGADLKPRTSIASLLKAIEKRSYTCRFRISSVDPDEVSDELIEFLKSSTSVCNHLHLPMQSGDDTILKRMNRPYTRAYLSERVEKLAASVPGISIGADVLTGFPGEGTEEFENTLSLLKGLPAAYLHVFPYSRRRGTPAALFPEQVDPMTVKERSARLRELDERKREEFYRGFIGTTALVVVEGAKDKATGMPKGRSRNYIPVIIDNGENGENGELGAGGFEGPRPKPPSPTGEVKVLLESSSAEGMKGIL